MTKPFYQQTPEELWEHFGKLAPRAKLKGGFVSVGAILFVIFIFWPAWFSRPLLEAQVQALKDQVAMARVQIHQEPRLLEEKKAYEDFVEEVQSRLFSEEQTQTLLGLLSEMGQRSEVTLLGTQPQARESDLPPLFEDRYGVFSYLVSVEGGYHELASFVSEIENYPKIFRVEGVSIKPREETNVLVGEIQISAFHKKEAA